MTIEFQEGSCASSLEDSRVTAVEHLVGHRFPKSYLAVLRQCNGGVPVPDIFEASGKKRLLERFLCFLADYKTNEMGDYEVAVVWSQIEDRLNDWLCPFAMLFGGDFLCFDFSPGLEPSVVLWQHELSAEKSPSVILVAENFEKFLAQLKME